MEYDAVNDLYVRTASMPIRIKAYIRSAGDDVIVTINDDLSDEAKRQALLHEIAHHRRNDLFKDEAVAALETLALDKVQK